METTGSLFAGALSHISVSDRGRKVRADVFTPRHVKAARAWLGWSAQELAKRAKCGSSTVRDFERGARKTSVATRKAIRRTLEAEGIVLTEHGFFQAYTDDGLTRGMLAR